MLIMRSMRGILRVIHDVTAVVVPLDRRRSGVFETHGALHAMRACQTGRCESVFGDGSVGKFLL